MQLMDMGYLKEIAPSRIAHVLPWITRIRNKNPKGDDTFNSELLLKRDITLKEHIWTIVPKMLIKKESQYGMNVSARPSIAFHWTAIWIENGY